MEKETKVLGPKILFNTSIEESLKIISSSDKGLATVVNAKGKTVGKVTLKNAIAAIERPSRDKVNRFHYK